MTWPSESFYPDMCQDPSGYLMLVFLLVEVRNTMYHAVWSSEGTRYS